MTVFEHAMLGTSLALTAGCHRRWGWPIAAMAGASAVFPDWDGLSLAFGGRAYDLAHRVWGHNVFVAVVGGGLIGLAGRAASRSERITVWIRRLTNVSPTSRALEIPLPSQPWDAILWSLVGAMAMLSHLLVDMIYSGHPHMEDWPVRLFWPVSDRGFAWPIVPWGDVGTTLLFVGEMFALYRWPLRAQAIAATTLGLVALYIMLRAMVA